MCDFFERCKFSIFFRQVFFVDLFLLFFVFGDMKHELFAFELTLLFVSILCRFFGKAFQKKLLTLLKLEVICWFPASFKGTHWILTTLSTNELNVGKAIFGTELNSLLLGAGIYVLNFRKLSIKLKMYQKTKDSLYQKEAYNYFNNNSNI